MQLSQRQYVFSIFYFWGFDMSKILIWPKYYEHVSAEDDRKLFYPKLDYR